jgi:AcrR family transcriptional regulator
MVQRGMPHSLSTRGQATKERLLDRAEGIVVEKGFAATSIEDLIAALGISRSSFFYYFDDKVDLARAIVLRKLRRDRELLDELCMRADELNEDPLHGFMVGLRMFAEMMVNLPEVHPGLIAATVAYHDHLYIHEIRELNARGVLDWRDRFQARLDRIAARHPPRPCVDLGALADMAATIVQGSMVVERALAEPAVVSRQMLLFRDYVRTVFTPELADLTDCDCEADTHVYAAQPAARDLTARAVAN